MCLILLLALGLGGCGLTDSGHLHPQIQFGSGLQILNQAKTDQVMALFQAKCVSCHGPNSPGQGNLNYITDVNALYTHGELVPGSSNISKLYLRCQDNSMPPAGPLSSAELNLIADWIDTALAASGPATPSNFPPQASLLTKQALTLLNNRCTSCHNESSGEALGGGVLNMLDPRQLVISGLVKPGSSTRSPLYIAVTPQFADGSVARMPKAPSVSLTTEETQILQQWIDTELTANPEGLTDYTPVLLAPTYSSLRRNIFATRCTVCHGGSRGVAGDNNFTTYAGVRNALNLTFPSASPLYTALSNGMPEEYAPLSAEEKQAVLDWITAGAPNN
jgi:mono/diheme cytochrome c family protein